MAPSSGQHSVFSASTGSNSKQMMVAEKRPEARLTSDIMFEPKKLEAMSFKDLTHGLKTIYETLDLRSNEIVPHQDR